MTCIGLSRIFCEVDTCHPALYNENAKAAKTALVGADSISARKACGILRADMESAPTQ